MSAKLSVLELPIYREHFSTYMEILEKLNELLKKGSNHTLLIKQAYTTTMQIYPYLTAGYNYWSTKEKLQIYNF